MVRSISGSFRSSRAIWNAYSLSWRPLGGKVVTRQIFMGRFVSKYADADEGSQLLVVAAAEVEKVLLLHSGGEANGITKLDFAAVLAEAPAKRFAIGNGKAGLHRVIGV